MLGMGMQGWPHTGSQGPPAGQARGAATLPHTKAADTQSQRLGSTKCPVVSWLGTGPEGARNQARLQDLGDTRKSAQASKSKARTQMLHAECAEQTQEKSWSRTQG